MYVCVGGGEKGLNQNNNIIKNKSYFYFKIKLSMICKNLPMFHDTVWHSRRFKSSSTLLSKSETHTICVYSKNVSSF